MNLSSKKGYRLCAGDTVLDPRRPIRGYGTTWRFRSVTCHIEQSGVTCRNAKRHGFFLSKARQRLF